jgi:hypothetical protein
MFNTRCSSFFMVKTPGHGLGFAASDAPQTRELWSQTGTSVGRDTKIWTGIWRFTGIYGYRIGCWSQIEYNI